MLTYSFDNRQDIPLYEYLYMSIKSDILTGKLKSGERLPSKRALSEHLKISTITVINAYEQLIAEGYIYSIEKKGYFVSRLDVPYVFKRNNVSDGITDIDIDEKQENNFLLNFNSNEIKKEYFPFSVWTKLMRELIKNDNDIILNESPFNGIYELRKSIASYLYFNRGIEVSPEQIIVGAGSLYLYNIIIQLLGRKNIYGVENPGYNKVSRIYYANDLSFEYIDIDDFGLSADCLKKSSCNIIHISPTHHFPTGITMPINRRYDILNWANEKDDRYIIEDDYDSEFRFSGKPIKPLYSIDESQKTIYMNTFTKTISPTLRISYMVLPKKLLEKYYKELGFYSSSVPVFDQYLLSEFISKGYFEKHLNRMKKIYKVQQKNVMELFSKSKYCDRLEIFEQDSGLHFLIKIKSDKSEEELKRFIEDKRIKVSFLSDYYSNKPNCPKKIAIINYSNIDTEMLKKVLDTI